MPKRVLFALLFSLLLAGSTQQLALAGPETTLGSGGVQPQITAARSATDALGTLLGEIQALSEEVHELGRMSRTGLTKEQALRLAEGSAELSRKSAILQARVTELRRLVERLEQLGNQLESDVAQPAAAAP